MPPSPVAAAAAGPVASAARIARKVWRRARLFYRGESPHTFFDVNDRELVDKLFTTAGLLSPRGDAGGPAAVTTAEQVYELREDLRTLMPLALTPFQRGEFLRWFLDHGRREFDVDPVALLALLRALDATPDRGLVATYLVQPEWQRAVPNALTPAGWSDLKRWLRERHGVRGRWLARATLPPDPPVSRAPAGVAGVNALGLFRYVSGLQQAGTAVVGALSEAGVPVACRDIPMPHSRDGRPRRGFEALEPFPVTILNTGIDMPVSEAYRLAALHPRADAYRVAVWWWELETLPPAWLGRGAAVDEIWAPTAFIAGAMRAFGKPVFRMLPSVVLPPFDPLPKRHFGLRDDRFAFLFAFDMKSLMPRKNPLGLIAAFRRAFRPTEPVDLVIKVSPQGRTHADHWRDLRAAAAAAGVTLIDRMLSRGELLALMNAADAYVSLHRSEGFGLTMAEAMLMGKPTVATGYSGNLDFMSPATSYLVDYRRTTIPVDYPPYPKGAPWAEPSLDHAAAQMRRVFDRPAEAQTVGARARADLLDRLSPRAAGRRMADRVAAIYRELAGRGAEAA